jgi:hypothetical protein
VNINYVLLFYFISWKCLVKWGCRDKKVTCCKIMYFIFYYLTLGTYINPLPPSKIDNKLEHIYDFVKAKKLWFIYYFLLY